MIGPDNTGTSLAISGFQGVDQMNREAEQKRQMNMPIPQAFADYIQRLMADPNADPKQLAQEARNHPEVQALLSGGGPQQPAAPLPRPQDSLSQVGPGAGPGSPALYAPGGMNPAHGPQAGMPPAQPQAQPQPAPQRPSFTQSLGQMGQPAQGAPPVSPQQAGAQGSGQYPRPNFPTPQFRGGDTMNYRELQAIGPHLPELQRTQSRQQVAGQQGDVRLQIQEMKGKIQQGVADLKAQGVSDANIVKMLLGTAQEEGKQERFVEGEKGKTERAKIGAGATLGAAKTRATTTESSDEKELRNLQTKIQGLTAKTKWEAQPELRAQVEEFRVQAKALATKLGKPYIEGSGGAPAPKSGKVPVRLKDGKTGWVEEGKVTPDMTRLPLPK